MNYFYQDFTSSFWRGHVPPNCGVSIVEVKDGTADVLKKTGYITGRRVTHEDFRLYYELPEELIAQDPLPNRSDSRLLHLTGKAERSHTAGLRTSFHICGRATVL